MLLTFVFVDPGSIREPSGTIFEYFPNSEILFDFNEGSSGVFKDHKMFYLVRGALPGIVARAPFRGIYSIW